MSRSRPTDPIHLTPAAPIDDPISQVGERIRLLFRVATALFVCGGAVGYLFLDKSAYPTVRDAFVMLGPLAMASMLLVAAGILSPDLVALGRIAFPLNCTLPLVFAAMVRLSVVLLTSQRSAVFPPFDPLLPTLVWTHPVALAAMAFIQCAALSAIAAFRRP